MTDLQPYQRFERWWDANGAHIEHLIVSNEYPRKWAYSQREKLRAWIITHTEVTYKEGGWKRRVGNWLSNGWLGTYMDEDKRRAIRQSEMESDGVRNYDGPPEV